GLQCLQILNHSLPLFGRKIVAKRVPGVASSGKARVVDSPPLVGRQLRVGGAVQDGEFPPEPLGVVVLLFRAKAPREDLGAGPGIQYLVDRGHGAVVEVRGRGPDTVQRRGLVAGGFGDRVPASLGALLLANHVLFKISMFLPVSDRASVGSVPIVSSATIL